MAAKIEAPVGMKWCPDCEDFQDLNNFHKNPARYDGVKPYCKEHSNTRERERWWNDRENQLERGRNYYARNSEEVLDRTFKRHLKFRERLYEIKSQPCVDCKKSYHPAAMDFDHVRGVKSFGVTILNAARHPWDTILSEIEKCELRCANCHRTRHALEVEARL